MDHLKQDFQLVVIDSPYEILERPLVEHLFTKMVGLKKQGYGSNYPHGVLPVDTTDFIATHVLLCQKKKDQSLLPIMGYKTITLEKCREYNLKFPGLTLVQNAQMPVHAQVVESIMQRCEQQAKGLAYLGSWTVDPIFKEKLKNKQEPKANLREAFLAFYRQLYRQQNVAEVIIGGTLRFGTEKIFYGLGHRALALNGQELSPIKVAHLIKEPVLVMHSAAFNETSAEAEKKWQVVWDERIHLKMNPGQQVQKRAA